MPAPAFAAKPAFEVVFFRKHHQTLGVEVEVFSFNKRFWDGFRRFRDHLK